VGAKRNCGGSVLKNLSDIEKPIRWYPVECAGHRNNLHNKMQDFGMNTMRIAPVENRGRQVKSISHGY
jgi:hypothetical protein